MSNELRSLLERLDAHDPGTAKELRRHIDTLQGRRQFGLNFERHMPESVDSSDEEAAADEEGDTYEAWQQAYETEVESEMTWLVDARDFCG